MSAFTLEALHRIEEEIKQTNIFLEKISKELESYKSEEDYQLFKALKKEGDINISVETDFKE